MKKLLIIAAAALLLKATGLLPFSGTDVAQLLPVRALLIDVENGQVFLDGGSAKGSGTTLNAALEDMKQGAEGTVFLATAEQVILSSRALGRLPELSRWDALRPGARVLLADGEVSSVEEAADYLEAHDSGLTLQQVRARLLAGQRVTLPLLHMTQGGFRLETRKNG